MSLGSCAGGELSVQGGPALRRWREATGVKVLGQQGVWGVEMVGDGVSGIWISFVTVKPSKLKTKAKLSLHFGVSRIWGNLCTSESFLGPWVSSGAVITKTGTVRCWRERMGSVSGSSCGFSDRCIYANKKRLSQSSRDEAGAPPSTGVGVTADHSSF